ncbi:MAG: tetratricopeptide repeat protein [Burkholderiaceae bacterium]
MKPPLLAVILTALSIGVGAAQAADGATTPESPTVRICDGSGCSDRPRDSATFQPTPADPEAERRLAELVTLGEQDVRAAYDLGLRFLRGDGVERNSFQAIEWMRKAGDRGHVEAQFALGRLYLMGFEEMGSDPAEAERWLTMAAAKGHKGAARLLPDATAAKDDERRLYQVREAHRRSWGLWYTSHPYYWTWGSRGWHLP